MFHFLSPRGRTKSVLQRDAVEIGRMSLFDFLKRPDIDLLNLPPDGPWTWLLGRSGWYGLFLFYFIFPSGLFIYVYP